MLNISPVNRRAFVWSSGWFATVLGAYYVVRPVRETLVSMEGDRNLPNLFAAVFVTMLVAVPVYSQLVAIFPRSKLVPVVYRFLALNLVAFSIAMRTLDDQSMLHVAKVFFVWVSVYVLFSTSLFWSVMADIFSNSDGRKLFGGIAGCGSIGSSIASFTVANTAERIGTENLLLISAGLMEVGLWCFRHLDSTRVGTTRPAKSISNPFDGFIRLIQNPYLRSIMLYVFVTTSCGTYLYMNQAAMLSAAWPDDNARAAVFAKIDLATQLVTLFFQFVLSTVVMQFSLTLALSVLPAIYLLGFVGLLSTQSVWVLMVTMVLARAGTYGMTVPATGVLYTVVTRDEKYKSKSIVDTLVIRGGDVATSNILSRIKSYGATFLSMTGGMLFAAAAGLALAALLGYRNRQMKDAAAGPVDEMNENSGRELPS